MEEINLFQLLERDKSFHKNYFQFLFCNVQAFERIENVFVKYLMSTVS